MNRNTVAKSVFAKNRVSREILSTIYTLKNGLTVFLFHDVTDSPSGFILETDMFSRFREFEKEITWINQNFEIIGIDDLLNGELPKNAALITFDDSWLGIKLAIERVLVPLKIQSTIFLNIGTVLTGVDASALGGYTSKSDSLNKIDLYQIKDKNPECQDNDFQSYQGELLTYEEILFLDSIPEVTFGNHLYEHFRASELTEEDFAYQVIQNHEQLQKFGSFRPVFAFPYGDSRMDFNKQQVEFVIRQGYKIVFKTESSRLRSYDGDIILPRIHFSSKDSQVSDFWWATFRNQVLFRSRK
jgi:peptidoglycan/xylan/chitin deacetylase (PgdA/CDA1 family)